MHWHLVVGFVIAVIPMTLIPGTSFTLVTQQVLAGTRYDGVRAAVGTACGLLVHATFAAVGLSALVMSSARALTVVRWLGGIYLIWLGVSTWRSARRGTQPAKRRRWQLPWSRLGGFGQGLWSNVLNPKAASVYLTLVPQFLSSEQPIPTQIATLTLAHMAVVLVWLLFWTTVLATARTVIDTPRFRRATSRLAGTILVVFGVRTAIAA